MFTVVAARHKRTKAFIRNVSLLKPLQTMFLGYRRRWHLVRSWELRWRNRLFAADFLVIVTSLDIFLFSWLRGPFVFCCVCLYLHREYLVSSLSCHRVFLDCFPPTRLCWSKCALAYRTTKRIICITLSSLLLWMTLIKEISSLQLKPEFCS